MVKVGAIILAAGMSTRMGSQKLFANLCGKPLFRYAVETVVQSKLSPIVLIGGENVGKLKRLTKDLPMVQVIANRNYSSGMASSLKRGIAEVAGKVDGAVIVLADQPLVQVEVIEQLIAHYKGARSRGIQIVRPSYNGKAGHPVLFDSQLFAEFDQIDGDEGGRSIVARKHKKLITVNFENGYWGEDVDTPKDLAKLQNYANEN
ncbi:nucleotidyltransferase family protein [Fictibacillus sp. Mic-4]|uniref:nucleotidyltransferase family protein n=1 Tax=Fictibacillus TaxID=1329200 RepID=UPI0003F5C422|nr:nucleotidyltransferase family protein [Fictibacillus gelatini]